MIPKDRMDWWRIFSGTGKSGGELALACADLLALQAENEQLQAERDRLKATVEKLNARHQPKAANNVTPCARHVRSIGADLTLFSDCPDCRVEPITVCSNTSCCGWPCAERQAIDAALDAVPRTPETTPKPAVINVPDRIDYDSNGELDDVVVKNCDAHLERMNSGRWYLGLYGNDGRIVQIDIASKTGRAEVTGLVKHSSGIAPETPGDAPAKPRHVGGRANAEDCPACSGTNPSYPFICPGEPETPGDAGTEQEGSDDDD